MTLKPASGFELAYQPSYYQITIINWSHNISNWLNYDSQLLNVSNWVLSLIWQNYHKIVKILFPLHICRRNDYTTEIDVLLQIQFFNTFANVLPIIFKILIIILKIYELHKINNTIPVYCQTLVLTTIIYQVNSLSHLHLASELYPYQLYWKCALGGKGLFWH